MKILLVETSLVTTTSDVTVHVRNSVEIAKYLSQRHDCRLVSREEDVLDVHEQFDHIIFVSATFYFKYQRYVELMKNQKNCKIGWLTNEFELFMNDFLKQQGVDYIISNFEEWGVKKAHHHNHYLMTNLNSLQARPRNPLVFKPYSVCYYGTYRKYREEYFKKYLRNDVILSTSGKNVKKFQLLGCDCWLTDKFSWEGDNETLNQFKASLYIEDSKTHKLFNHMANRFFEGLFCNCAIFFDKSCLNTIRRDKYIIDDWFIITSYIELINKTLQFRQEWPRIDKFLEVNTKIALEEKQYTLQTVERFLLEMSGDFCTIKCEGCGVKHVK